MLHSAHRRWCQRAFTAALLFCAISTPSAWAEHGDHDRLVALERATHDSSWRVRLQAAAVLSRQHSTKVEAIFERLLDDPNETVRGVAVGALGEFGTHPNLNVAAIRAALERATSDGNALVRKRAAAALAKLGARAATPIPATTDRTGMVHVVIGGIGAKAKNVTPDMTRRLRELLVREFAATPELVIDGTPVKGFLIDSSITALSRSTTRNTIEVNCEISVIVGRLPSKAVVMMTSGGATVQEPLADFKPGRGPSLEADALEGAVKGAHENLLVYLRRQR